MNLLFKIVVICLPMKACICMRNFHMPHSYFHNLAMQHDDNNYEHYDSSSSEGIVLRSHRKKQNIRKHVDSEYSDSNHNYKWQCKCSCVKCKKANPKACCMEFCAQQCDIQSNILVVPYPVPFMVQPLNISTFPPTTTSTTASVTTSPTTSPTTSTTTRTTTVLTTTDTPETRKTLPDTQSTAPIYQYSAQSEYKRFRIVPDNKLRRSMGNKMRTGKFDRLPKYGIVPIPEHLALTMMQQIRNNQNNDHLGRRRNFNKNLMDYTH